MRRFIVCAVVIIAGCRQPGLNSSVGVLHVAPNTLNFGAVYTAQQPRKQTFRLSNDGRASLLLKWGEPESPFHIIDPLPQKATTGDTEISVAFAPVKDGTYRSIVRIEAEGQEPLLVSLTGEARPVPTCPTVGTCFESAFDLQLERCVERPQADGTSCDGTSACLSNATCQAGRCVGIEKSCDDHDKCTLDTCNDVIGCEHLPAPPCPGDGSCQVGVCNAATGCGFADADDGTQCGAMQTCNAAQVCISGACVVRDPPDGYVCAEASPCQGEGVCVADVCVRAPATTLSPNWSYDSMTADAGSGAAQQLHDLVLEPSGAVSLSGFFFTAPQLRANTAAAKEARLGAARRCMLWNGRMICADYPASVNGKVSALDLATGELVWTFDLHTAKPEFLALTSSLFMARMAVQGSDRLAALFEAYPKSTNPATPTNCRLYFLVVLDASGKLVTAQQVVDPVLQVCNHPHPYGFGADALGDLFISFSPTITSPAPLVPGTPTVVMSYTRDGVFRWKFTDFSLVGGELAVARGLLYPENSANAVLTSSGQPAFTLNEQFGRAVVSRQRTIVAPVTGAMSLNGYESGTNTPRWQHLLGPGQSFGSDQVRLANWSTRKGPTTVALTFTRHNGQTQLHGIVARDGSEAFTCNVAMSARTEPQLFEVADGSLALMEGSDACGKCDPPFAGSSAAFHTLLVPTLSPAVYEPWVGTFGGAGHDHREESFTEQVSQTRPPR